MRSWEHEKHRIQGVQGHLPVHEEANGRERNTGNQQPYRAET
jgi:hypothetical protein